MITSKPATCYHFKTGQRSRTQDMKLLYLAGVISDKSIPQSPTKPVMPGPDQREGGDG